MSPVGSSPAATAAGPVETSEPNAPAVRSAELLRRDTRWRPLEIAIYLILPISWFALPGQALVLHEIAILGLFALSLDLILGYAGIVSLGHSAFFGLGAYTAALFAKYYYGDPWVGLVIATGVAALLGAATSFLILRGSDLTRLMVTLGVASILYEVANKMADITGGADGLQGVVMGPIVTPFGRFDFDIYGRVGYAYTLFALIVWMLIARRIVHSPFGFSLQALRDNRLRATAIGLSVNARVVAVYTLAGAIAGTAGGLLAQTSGFASLDAFDFHRSADVLLVLVIGGTGWLYGGLVGAIVFTALRDVISAWTPQYWNFWLGIFLVVLVLVGRERLLQPRRWFRRGAARPGAAR